MSIAAIAIVALMASPVAEKPAEIKTIEPSGHVENGIVELTIYAPPPRCAHFYKCLSEFKG